LTDLVRAADNELFHDQLFDITSYVLDNDVPPPGDVDVMFTDVNCLGLWPSVIPAAPVVIGEDEESAVPSMPS